MTERDTDTEQLRSVIDDIMGDDEEVTENEKTEIAVFVPRGVSIPKEKRREVILAHRKLNWKKRLFLRYLSENGWHPRNAYTAMMVDRVTNTKWRTVTSWLKQPTFYHAMKELRSFDIERIEAVDPDRILMDHRRIADYGLDVIETTNAKTGKKTKRMRNPATALSALDKLGKHKKLWGTEEQVARIVVDIVDLTGPQHNIIDVTPEPVDGDRE